VITGEVVSDKVVGCCGGCRVGTSIPIEESVAASKLGISRTPTRWRLNIGKSFESSKSANQSLSATQQKRKHIRER